MTTMSVSSGPAPAYLDPTWRYARNAWAGANALTYTVWQTSPVFAADGVTVVSPGVPLDLTGYAVAGSIRYRPPRQVFPGLGGGIPSGSILYLPAPIGSIWGDPTEGRIALSLPLSATDVSCQPLADWTRGPEASLLLAEPKVIDPSGSLVTIGLQPLFVFGC